MIMASYNNYPSTNEKFEFPPPVMKAIANSSYLDSKFMTQASLNNALAFIASGYDVAKRVDNFQGTESEWLDSLKGDKGDPGPYGGTEITDPQLASMVDQEDSAFREKLLSTLTTSGTQPVGKNELTVSVIDYGASNSSSDNSLAFSKAMEEASSRGLSVWVPAGNYKFLSTLVIPSKTTLEMHSNAVLDFTQCTSTTLAKCTGVGETTLYSVTSSPKGGYDLTVPGHNFSPGDWVKIYSDDIFDPKNTKVPNAEMLQIKEVSVDAIKVWSPVSDTYATSPKIFRVAMARDISISGGTFLGNGIPDSGFSGLVLEYAYNVRIVNVAFKDIDSRQLFVSNSVHCWIENCRFKNAYSSGLGYGVSFGNATRDSGVMKCHFTYIRHAFSTNNNTVPPLAGIVRRVQFAFNVVENSAPALGSAGGDAIDTHGAAENVDILYNRVVGAGGSGINIECPSARVVGNEIMYCLQYGIFVHNESDRDSNYIIANNNIFGVSGGSHSGIREASGLRAGSGRTKSVLIQNNLITNQFIGIQVGLTNSLAPSYSENAVVTSNVIKDCTSHGIYALRVSGLTINSNVISNTLSGVRIESSEFASVGPDSIKGTGSNFIAINALTLSRSRIQPGAISTPYTGVYIDANSADISVGASTHIKAATPINNKGVTNVIVGS